jgi:metal-sulfur cluster biosynthetic enzyme
LNYWLVGLCWAVFWTGLACGESEIRYEQRTDSVEKKLRLLQAAYQAGNRDLALSLAESIRETLSFERQMQGGEEGQGVDAETFARVSELPEEWSRWAHGWEFYKVLELRETGGLERVQEPVDVPVAFLQDQVGDLQREVRVARLDQVQGTLSEVVCQVYGEKYAEGKRQARLVFMANVSAGGRAWYLVLYGNPFAELPEYGTDMQVSGEGYGLDIENRYYKARLSRQTGQLERLTYAERGQLELFARGDAHGEPPHIDWAHDYVGSNGFQKFRMTNWAQVPNYEVVKGPLCVRVRRWGFPHSPVHPLFAPSRMHMDIEYTFYAGQPYFFKKGRIEAIQDFEITYLRDDEWVFSQGPFTDSVWMDRDGVLHEGAVTGGHGNDLWGVGFFHRETRDAFIALFLQHSAENFDALNHAGSPKLHRHGDGQIWSRWAASGGPSFKAGAVLKQRNAYLLMQYEGTAKVEQTRKKLLQPLQVGAGVLPGGLEPTAVEALARRGETQETAALKPALWAALRQVKDAQLYTVDGNVVDMGYIYDLRVRGDRVHVLMTMPHRGRPKYGFVGQPVRQRLLEVDGVGQVEVDFTWEPAWTAARLTRRGRQVMGLEE